MYNIRSNRSTLNQGWFIRFTRHVAAIWIGKITWRISLIYINKCYRIYSCKQKKNSLPIRWKVQTHCHSELSFRNEPTQNRPGRQPASDPDWASYRRVRCWSQTLLTCICVTRPRWVEKKGKPFPCEFHCLPEWSSTWIYSLSLGCPTFVVRTVLNFLLHQQNKNNWQIGINVT